MIVSRILSTVFKAWGKTLPTDVVFKDYWMYICDALDGSWGSTVTDQLTVYHIGRVCFWKTNIFTATDTSKTLDIPVVSNESYAVTVYDLSSGLVKCLKGIARSNSLIVSDLIVGNEYQIVSINFVHSPR